MEKRRTRGPTVNRILDQVPFGGRLEVTWRNRRAVGESSKLFKSACTALVRQTREIPLQVKSWKSIPIDIKKKAFERILVSNTTQDLEGISSHYLPINFPSNPFVCLLYNISSYMFLRSVSKLKIT